MILNVCFLAEFVVVVVASYFCSWFHFLIKLRAEYKWRSGFKCFCYSFSSKNVCSGIILLLFVSGEAESGICDTVIITEQ